MELVAIVGTANLVLICTGLCCGRSGVGVGFVRRIVGSSVVDDEVWDFLSHTG